MLQINRFEFTLNIGKAQRTVQIRGNGGNLGDGCAYLTDGDKIDKAAKSLLGKARAELRRTGELHVGFPIPEVLVTTAENPINIVDCYPVFEP